MGGRSGRERPGGPEVARRPGDTSPRRQLRLRAMDAEVEDLVMSASELRRLKRSIAEASETRRYLIESRLMPGFTFYYNVSDHGYGLNDPGRATLFHQRKQALAVAAFLGKRMAVVRYETRIKDGVRVPIIPKPKKMSTSKANPRSRRRRG